MKLRLLAAGLALLAATPASAFCGFYVAKADTKLFNKAMFSEAVRKEDMRAVFLE